MRQIFSALLLFVLLLSQAKPALSCFFYDPDASIHDHELIFLGEVISVEENYIPKIDDLPRIILGTRITYKVRKAYKGLSIFRNEIDVVYKSKPDRGYFEEGEIGLVVGFYNDRYQVYEMGTEAIRGSICQRYNHNGIYQNEDIQSQVNLYYESWWYAKAVGLVFILGFLFLFVARRKENTAPDQPPDGTD